MNRDYGESDQTVGKRRILEIYLREAAALELTLEAKRIQCRDVLEFPSPLKYDDTAETIRFTSRDNEPQLDSDIRETILMRLNEEKEATRKRQDIYIPGIFARRKIGEKPKLVMVKKYKVYDEEDLILTKDRALISSQQKSDDNKGCKSLISYKIDEKNMNVENKRHDTAQSESEASINLDTFSTGCTDE